MAYPGCCMPACGESWLNNLPTNCNTPQCYCPICAVNKGALCSLLTTCWTEAERTDAILYVNVTCSSFVVAGLQIPSDAECGLSSTTLGTTTQPALATLATATTSASPTTTGGNSTALAGAGAGTLASTRSGLTTGQKVGIGVGVGAGVPLLALLLVCCFFVYRRKRKDKSGAIGGAGTEEKLVHEDSSQHGSGNEKLDYYGAVGSDSNESNLGALGAAGAVGAGGAAAAYAANRSRNNARNGGRTVRHGEDEDVLGSDHDEEFIAGQRRNRPGRTTQRGTTADEVEGGQVTGYGGGASGARRGQGQENGGAGDDEEDFGGGIIGGGVSAGRRGKGSTRAAATGGAVDDYDSESGTAGPSGQGRQGGQRSLHTRAAGAVGANGIGDEGDGTDNLDIDGARAGQTSAQALTGSQQQRGGGEGGAEGGGSAKGVAGTAGVAGAAAAGAVVGGVLGGKASQRGKATGVADDDDLDRSSDGVRHGKQSPTSQDARGTESSHRSSGGAAFAGILAGKGSRRGKAVKDSEGGVGGSSDARGKQSQQTNTDLNGKGVRTKANIASGRGSRLQPDQDEAEDDMYSGTGLLSSSAGDTKGSHRQVTTDPRQSGHGSTFGGFLESIGRGKGSQKAKGPAAGGDARTDASVGRGKGSQRQRISSQAEDDVQNGTGFDRAGGGGSDGTQGRSTADSRQDSQKGGLGVLLGGLGLGKGSQQSRTAAEGNGDSGAANFNRGKGSQRRPVSDGIQDDPHEGTAATHHEVTTDGRQGGTSGGLGVLLGGIGLGKGSQRMQARRNGEIEGKDDANGEVNGNSNQAGRGDGHDAYSASNRRGNAGQHGRTSSGATGSHRMPRNVIRGKDVQGENGVDDTQNTQRYASGRGQTGGRDDNFSQYSGPGRRSGRADNDTRSVTSYGSGNGIGYYGSRRPKSSRQGSIANQYSSYDYTSDPSYQDEILALQSEREQSEGLTQRLSEYIQTGAQEGWYQDWVQQHERASSPNDWIDDEATLVRLLREQDCELHDHDHEPGLCNHSLDAVRRRLMLIRHQHESEIYTHDHNQGHAHDHDHSTQEHFVVSTAHDQRGSDGLQTSGELEGQSFHGLHHGDSSQPSRVVSYLSQGNQSRYSVPTSLETDSLSHESGSADPKTVVTRTVTSVVDPASTYESSSTTGTQHTIHRLGESVGSGSVGQFAQSAHDDHASEAAKLQFLTMQRSGDVEALGSHMAEGGSSTFESRSGHMHSGGEIKSDIIDESGHGAAGASGVQTSVTFRTDDLPSSLAKMENIIAQQEASSSFFSSGTFESSSAHSGPTHHYTTTHFQATGPGENKEEVEEAKDGKQTS